MSLHRSPLYILVWSSSMLTFVRNWQAARVGFHMGKLPWPRWSLLRLP